MRRLFVVGVVVVCNEPTPLRNYVLSLEHALRELELVQRWWTENTCSPFETFKTVLFIYVLFTQTLRVFRHLRARGLGRSVADGYLWTFKALPLLRQPR